MRDRTAGPSPWLPRGRAAVAAAAAWAAAVGLALVVSLPSGNRPPPPEVAVVPAQVAPPPARPPSTVFDRDGQSILFGDGDIPDPNPFMDTQHNIFTGRGLSATTAASVPPGSGPYDGNDSVLFPLDR